MNFHLMPTVKTIRVTDAHAKIHKSDVYLSEDIKRYVKKGNEVISGDGHVEISLNQWPELSKEAYRIKVSGDGIEITASTPNGAYYALCTLSQIFMLNQDEICHLEIEDEPDMPLRGISDDISRGQISTFQNFKDIIKRMSLVKCNVYMPYMEDTFEFKAYPESGKFSDPVTQDEWKALIEYAKDYYVEILPIFNTIGHWDKNAYLEYFYPYVMKENDDENGLPLTSVDVRKPESREMIFRMLDELSEVFRDVKAIHVGGDEVGDYTRLFKKDLAGQYYNEHFVRVYEHLKKKGIKTYMYSDMYTPLYGDYALGIDYIDQMPQDMNFVFWDYAVRKDYPNIQNLIDRNKSFCLSPATYTWNRFLPQHYISFINTKRLAQSGQKHARGIIMSAWNDGGLALREENWMGIYTVGLFAWQCTNEITFEDTVQSFFKLFYGIDIDMDQYLRLMAYDKNFVSHPYDDAFYGGKIEFWFDQWQNGGAQLLKEFFKDAAKPSDEELKTKLTGCEEIFASAYDYFTSLKPIRNQSAYDAFVFDIKRSLIAVQKIFMLSDKPFMSREEAMKKANEIDAMIGKISGLKEEHKVRWFEDNRQSEWNTVKARYDDLIDSFKSLKRYALNGKRPQAVKKL